MEKIKQIVLEALKTLGDELGDESLKNADETTKLYGKNSSLSSIDLVTLVVDIEEKIESELGKNVVLADEKAMSAFDSPFRDVGSLCEYISKHV
ncbi:MAG: hypothetical protein SPF98_03920 [Campylobacter sp.]|nr:hypothetical protein [Campylobacter sp.]